MCKISLLPKWVEDSIYSLVIITIVAICISKVVWHQIKLEKLVHNGDVSWGVKYINISHKNQFKSWGLFLKINLEHVYAPSAVILCEDYNQCTSLIILIWALGTYHLELYMHSTGQHQLESCAKLPTRLNSGKTTIINSKVYCGGMAVDGNNHVHCLLLWSILRRVDPSTTTSCQMVWSGSSLWQASSGWGVELS